jgi:cytochrome c
MYKRIEIFWVWIRQSFKKLQIKYMKQFLITAGMAIALIACGSNETTKTEVAADAVKTETTSISDNPDYQAGLALVAQSDCLTCHKVEEKNIGPAYREVAAKYENTPENITMLAGKIVKGGTGVWGEVPMTPHPQISQEDAEKMVKYILLLKK